MKIKLNDKEYGLHWGMGAIRLFCDATGYEFEKGVECVCGFGEYNVLDRTKAIVTMLLSAIQNYANIHNEDASGVTFYQLEAYRDATSQKEFQLIMDDFTGSMLNGRTMAESLGIATPETAQKKSPKASTKKSLSSTK